MSHFSSLSRRAAIKTSALGLLGVSAATTLAYGGKSTSVLASASESGRSTRYPSIDDSIVSELVGASHFNLDRVRELVDKRPELARATWDWGFGDWESAIGAAGHVGRRDIIEYLLSKGARPNIFTFATLGSCDVVKSMVDFQPGIQKILGPHGFSLLHHAEVSLRMKDSMTAQNIESAEKLIDYLKSLGDAGGDQYEEMDEASKQKYLGDYRYGDGPEEGFTVRLNMRKLLSLGRLGNSGGSLFKIGDNRFIYNGAPSTVISFQWNAENVISLTVDEPDSKLVARKV